MEQSRTLVTEPADETTTTLATTTTTTRVRDFAAEAAACTPADPDTIATVEVGLTGDADHLEMAFQEADPFGHVWISAHIYDAAGKRVSSSDTWVIIDGLPFAYTSSAREYSTWPDGRDHPEVAPYPEVRDVRDTVEMCPLRVAEHG